MRRIYLYIQKMEMLRYAKSTMMLYLLYRRIDSQSKNGLLKYIENEPLKEARLSDYACFFNLKSVQEGERISKQYPGKI